MTAEQTTATVLEQLAHALREKVQEVADEYGSIGTLYDAVWDVAAWLVEDPEAAALVKPLIAAEVGEALDEVERRLDARSMDAAADCEPLTWTDARAEVRAARVAVAGEVER